MNQRISSILRTGMIAAIILSAGPVIASSSQLSGTISTGLGGNLVEGIVISTPTATPTAGTYTSAQSVILSSSGGATSIHYTVNGTDPTCSTGLTYSSAIAVSSSLTIKALSCYPSSNASAVIPFAYVLNISSGGGGGGGSNGGGGGGAVVLPVVSTVPIVAPPVIPTTPATPPSEETAPAAAPAPVASGILNPADYFGLLAGLNVPSNPTAFEKYKPIVRAYAKANGLAPTEEEVRATANFIVYGISFETVKLGEGERLALVRDYFETIGRSDIVWSDLQRLTTGQKPLKRNLAKEQSQATLLLANFKRMVGHAPNFKDVKEDLGWNTLVYRIRFARDLKKEQQGIVEFKKIMGKNPSSPLDWAMVRALGYAL